MVLDLTQLRPSNRALLGGLAIGLLHAIASLMLWEYFNFENPFAAFAREPAYAVYMIVGMLLLGIVPGIFILQDRIVSPPILIGGLFLFGAYGTWKVDQSGLTPVDPTPFGWYNFLWPGIVVVAVVAGGIEYWLRNFSND